MMIPSMRQRISFAVGFLLFFASTVSPTLTTAAPAQGALIKIACPASAAPDHPCKAVYFYGHDGTRHAFPNEKVYFTWYADFSSVQTVSTAFLASITLGPNVTYRPGVKMVKFQTLDKVYAVALGGSLRWIKTESAAASLYGTDWNKKVDDISDVFFLDYRFGADIASAADYDRSAELTVATSIDDNLASTFRSERIVTSRGSFDVDVVRMQRDRFDMITDTGDTVDCHDGCTVKPLSAYVSENNASIGIHGTYFCPAEYPDCTGKTNSYHGSVYNTAAQEMLNAGDLPIHQGPLMASATDGRMFYFHRSSQFGASVSAFEAAQHVTLQAALANYPSLVENGSVIVESEARLAETNPTLKSLRGGMGFDDHFVYLVIAHTANVTDLAYVMQTLGAKQALNLDGGGSAALIYGGASVVGPGRALPNAIVFKQK